MARKAVAVGLLGLLIEATGACATASLMRSGDASALMLLPLTLTFDAIHLAIASALGGKGNRGAGPVINPALGWHDPDDWVATCEGPLLCPEHRHFQCTGQPHECTCSCVVTQPEPAAVHEVALRAP
jgi:hypothetical protein